MRGWGWAGWRRSARSSPRSASRRTSPSRRARDDGTSQRPIGCFRGWASAALAITFLTALTGLTGGLASPFTAGFFLVVGAAALSRDGLTAIVLALVASLAAGAAALVAASDRAFERDILVGITFQAVALVLLAVIGAVASREQRRAREAALRLARFDPLTGLYNRAHFFTELERELRLSQRAGRSFASSR